MRSLELRRPLVMAAAGTIALLATSSLALSQTAAPDASAARKAFEAHMARMNAAEHAATRPATPAKATSAAPQVRVAQAKVPPATKPATKVEDPDAATERGLEQYRRMMRDDPWANPALLDVDRGEALWTEPRGPDKVALSDKCDLGKGPGKVEGAFAELPRYFKDVDRVMDTETRILWCMEKYQAYDSKAFRKRPHPSGGHPVKDIGAMATFVASKSATMKFDTPNVHPKEKQAIALGEALFNRRQGPFDFSCATCHSDAGKRIRLQPLPFLSQRAEARKVIGQWPAYRVSSTHVMTMQHRLLDCYWQMRLHRLDFGSDVSIALTAYLYDQARGGEIQAPGLKR